jgi:hypothetical protein
MAGASKSLPGRQTSSTASLGETSPTGPGSYLAASLFVQRASQVLRGQIFRTSVLRRGFQLKILLIAPRLQLLYQCRLRVVDVRDEHLDLIDGSAS